MAQRDTFKFGMIVWIILGLIVPLWPISLPICWWRAYRSYKRGDDPAPTLTDLQTAVELHKQGIVSDKELERFKRKALG